MNGASRREPVSSTVCRVAKAARLSAVISPFQKRRRVRRTYQLLTSSMTKAPSVLAARVRFRSSRSLVTDCGHALQPAEDPAVEQIGSGSGRGVAGPEAVQVRVEGEEVVGVLQGGQQLALSLLHALEIEARGGPDRAAVIMYQRSGSAPSSRMISMGSTALPTLLDIFLPLLSRISSLHQAALVAALPEQEGADDQHGVEPAAGLVDALADEVGGELALEELLVLEGIVVLGEGHAARIEPAVDDLGRAAHGALSSRRRCSRK